MRDYIMTNQKHTCCWLYVSEAQEKQRAAGVPDDHESRGAAARPSPAAAPRR